MIFLIYGNYIVPQDTRSSRTRTTDREISSSSLMIMVQLKDRYMKAEINFTF